MADDTPENILEAAVTARDEAETWVTRDPGYSAALHEAAKELGSSSLSAEAQAPDARRLLVICADAPFAEVAGVVKRLSQRGKDIARIAESDGLGKDAGEAISLHRRRLAFMARAALLSRIFGEDRLNAVVAALSQRPDLRGKYGAHHEEISFAARYGVVDAGYRTFSSPRS